MPSLPAAAWQRIARTQQHLRNSIKQIMHTANIAYFTLKEYVNYTPRIMIILRSAFSEIHRGSAAARSELRKIPPILPSVGAACRTDHLVHTPPLSCPSPHVTGLPLQRREECWQISVGQCRVVLHSCNLRRPCEEFVQMPAPTRRVLARPVPPRRCPVEHVFDPATESLGSLRLRRPDRLQHLQDERGVDGAHGQIAPWSGRRS